MLMDSVRLQAAVDRLEANAPIDVPGISEMVIIRNGRVIWQGSEPNQTELVYSVTKSFATTMLGLLIDDGVVSLDTLAKDYVPDLAGLYPDVSLRNLATHTSGYLTRDEIWPLTYNTPIPEDSFDPVEPLFSPPGSYFAYSGVSGMDQMMNDIEMIRQDTGQGDPMVRSRHLKKLLDTSPMRKAKIVVIAHVTRAFPRGWADRETLDADFNRCFAELIMKKVDCAKLQYPDSLGSYVKKSIPAMLLDSAYKDVYGLSYREVVHVGRMREAKQCLRQQFGRKPSNEEVAMELQISMAQLDRITQWERSISQYQFDDRQDECS